MCMPIDVWVCLFVCMCVFCVCVSVCIDQISIRCFPPLLHLKNYMIYFFLSLYSPLPMCACAGAHVLYGGQRTDCRSWFSISTVGPGSGTQTVSLGSQGYYLLGSLASFSPSSLRQWFSLDLELANLTRLIGHLSGSCCPLCFPRVEITGMCYHTWRFLADAEIWTQSSCVVSTEPPPHVLTKVLKSILVLDSCSSYRLTTDIQQTDVTDLEGRVLGVASTHL